MILTQNASTHISEWEVEGKLTWAVNVKSQRGSSNMGKGSVTVVLGDKQYTDSFDVEMFVDQRYGGIMFNTTGGQSSCPHEANTVPIFNPKLEVTTESIHVLPDDEIIFNVTLQNQQDFSGTFELFPSNVQNIGGLSLSLNGAPFSLPQLYFDVGSKPVHTLLTVKRGPSLYEYPTIDISARPICSANTGVPIPSEDSSEYGSATLYNGENSLVFVSPCPMVTWADDLAINRRFIMNSQSEPSASAFEDPFGYLKVVIHNPMYTQGLTIQDLVNPEVSRLQYVKLFYKYKGGGDMAEWQTAFGKDSRDDDTIVELDYTSNTNEDNYGYSSMLWKVPIKNGHIEEGEYNIRVQSECSRSSTGNSRFDQHSTLIISGVVDVTPPKLYGPVFPTALRVSVGEEIRMEWTESIACSDYYKFNLTIQLQSTQGLLNFDQQNDEVQMVCDQRSLSFRFYPEAQLLPGNTANFIATVYNVTDLFGNVANAVNMTKTITTTTSEAGTSTRFRLLSRASICDTSTKTLMNEAADKLEFMIHDALGLSEDSNRIIVERVKCGINEGGDQEVWADVRIQPSQPGLENINDETSLELFYRLFSYSQEESKQSGLGKRRRLQISKMHLIQDEDALLEARSVSSIANTAEAVPDRDDVLQLLAMRMETLVEQQEESKLRQKESELRQKESERGQNLLITALGIMCFILSLLLCVAIGLLLLKKQSKHTADEEAHPWSADVGLRHV